VTSGKPRTRGLALLALLCAARGFFVPAAAAEDISAQDTAGGGRPEIAQLDSRDLLFRQYEAAVAAGRRIVANGGPPEAALAALALYRYRAKPDDELLALAARCNIPYETIATLNRLGRVSSLSGPAFLLLPSEPGLFLPEAPDSDLERLLAAAHAGEESVPITVTLPAGPVRFRFLPGTGLSPTERAFFLNDTQFRFPLKTFTLTSAFGLRTSPITGQTSRHGGLDLAAPAGTDVYAARAGTVEETGASAVYGNYVVLRHSGGWTSLYGHLSVITAREGDELAAGGLVGKVGSTGLSTGPHLHFTVYKNGSLVNPRRLMN